MGPIRSLKNIDFSKKSEPWTEQELADFRIFMKAIKAKSVKRKGTIKKAGKVKQPT